MKRHLVIFTLAFLAGSARSGEMAIKLTAIERAGVERKGEFVSTGVPFARGQLSEAELRNFALLDASGKPVPAQFGVTCRWWPGRSVRWVLVDFAADVPANGRTVYTLKTRSDPVNVPNPIKVTGDKDKVTVVTGPLKFTVRRKNFNLFDEVWVDETGKGEFSEANRAVKSHQGGLFVLSSHRGLPRNKVYSSVHFADGTLEVEEAGPIRATIKVTGRHASIDDLEGPKEMLDYVVRIYAWRGSTSLEVVYSLHNRQGKTIGEALGMDGLYVELPLATRGKPTFRLGKQRAPVAGALPADGSAWVLADADDHHAFGGAAASGDEGKCKSAPPEELGWVDLSDGSRGCAAGIWRFWQLNPTALEARGDGRLGLHLWANLDQKVLKCPPDWNPDKDLDTLVSHIVPGRAVIFPGMSKTHRMFFHFHGGKATTEEIRRAWHALSRPVRAVCTPERYCQEGQGFGRLVAIKKAYFPDEVWPKVEAFFKNVWKNFDFIISQRKRAYSGIDSYGYFDFGDGPNYDGIRGVKTEGRPRLRILWDNNYYDFPYALYLLFCMTGDLDYLDRAEEYDIHCADIDMMCWHPNPAMVGCSRYCPSRDHVRWDWGRGHRVYAASVCSWHKANFARWWLLGDRLSYDMNYTFASYVGRSYELICRSSGHGSRSFGHALKNAMIGYEATGEAKFLAAGRWLNDNKRGFRGGRSYQVGLALEGFYYYWRNTGDPGVVEVFKKHVGPEGSGGTKLLASGVLSGMMGDRGCLRRPLATLGFKGKFMWGAIQQFGAVLRSQPFFFWYISKLPKKPDVPSSSAP